MSFDFDRKINRKNTNCIKWDRTERFFGADDLTSAWVADMDFISPPAVYRAVEEYNRDAIYGYTDTFPEYTSATLNWWKNKHGYKTKPEWQVYAPGVLPLLYTTVRAFTRPGDEIIIQPPIYPPFYECIEKNGREVLKNPLRRNTDGSYEMDFDHLNEIITPKTKAIILCSPHNPVGRVWSERELNILADIICENNLILITDEIHADLVYAPNKHIPIANLNDDIAERSISLTSPAKTFNLQAFQSANAFVKNEELRKKLVHEIHMSALYLNPPLAQTAIIAAYTKSDDWLAELLSYLMANRDFVIKTLHDELPEISMSSPEGTYLAWLDFNGFNKSAEKIKSMLIHDAALALNDGRSFGEEGSGYFRLNFGAPRSLIEEVLNKLINTFKK